MGLMASVEMTIEADNAAELLEKDYAMGEMVDRTVSVWVNWRPFINICIISPPLS